MKKIKILSTILVLSFSLFGCGNVDATNKNIKTVVTQNPKIKIEDFEFIDSSFDVELIGTNFEDYFTTKIKNNSNYYIKEAMFNYDTCGSYTYLCLKNLEKGEISEDVGCSVTDDKLKLLSVSITYLDESNQKHYIEYDAIKNTYEHDR